MCVMKTLLTNRARVRARGAACVRSGALVCEALCGRLSKPCDASFNCILSIGHNNCELVRFKMLEGSFFDAR